MSEAVRQFAFHWEGGKTEWEHLRVVSFHVRDAISEPFNAKIVVHARSEDDEVDPEALIGKLGTLRIRTTTDPAVRCFHGLIVEAAELGHGPHGMLYEVTLGPPVLRAGHRVKSRIFLEKSTKEILEAVLTGDSKMKSDDPSPEHPEELTDA